MWWLLQFGEIKAVHVPIHERLQFVLNKDEQLADWLVQSF